MQRDTAGVLLAAFTQAVVQHHNRRATGLDQLQLSHDLSCVLLLLNLLVEGILHSLTNHVRLPWESARSLTRSRIHNCNLVVLVRNDTQELKRFITGVLVVMYSAFRDEYHVAGCDLVTLRADTNPGASAQDILFMFHGVGVARHAAALLHAEAAPGEIGAFI